MWCSSMPLSRSITLWCEKCKASLTLVVDADSDKQVIEEAELCDWAYVPDEFYHFEGECFCPEHKPEKVPDAH